MEVVSDLFFSDKFRNAAAILGTLFVGRLILRELCDFLNGFRAFFLAPLGIGRLNLKKYGKWAVVTGASDGIGKAYALELASRGLNVVLMSRSEEKLNKVAKEIREKFGRDTRVIPVDFSGGLEIYAPLAKELESLDIGVLVNNVGYMYERYLLCDVPPEQLYKTVQICCQPVVQMSRMLLPKMSAKGCGVIVNISSSVSIAPHVSYVVYCASKIFVDYVSAGLRKEYGAKGIIVQNVMPFGVVTKMLKNNIGIEKAQFLTPSPATYAKSAVAAIGIQSNTYGCFSHALQGYFMRKWIPEFVVDKAMTKMVKAAAKTN